MRQMNIHVIIRFKNKLRLDSDKNPAKSRENCEGCSVPLLGELGATRLLLQEYRFNTCSSITRQDLLFLHSQLSASFSDSNLQLC